MFLLSLIACICNVNYIAFTINSSNKPTNVGLCVHLLYIYFLIIYYRPIYVGMKNLYKVCQIC